MADTTRGDTIIALWLQKLIQAITVPWTSFGFVVCNQTSHSTPTETMEMGAGVDML